jgi:hypothetical protein
MSGKLSSMTGEVGAGGQRVRLNPGNRKRQVYCIFLLCTSNTNCMYYNISVICIVYSWYMIVEEKNTWCLLRYILCLTGIYVYTLLHHHYIVDIYMVYSSYM